MNRLPQDKNLPIHNLVACFNNTSATYKYYWLLSLLYFVENDKTIITKREMFARMISTAWYTVNYFHVSFGKQDQLQKVIKIILKEENLTIDLDKEIVYNRLIETENDNTIRELSHFNKQVPHWFLSPWFRGKDKGEIYELSQRDSELSPYALYDTCIIVKLRWLNYFIENAGLIKDFCFWNLAIFLQSKNPSIPDIPNKLIKPAIRNNLTQQRKQFWDIVLKEKGSIQCIYTRKPLVVGNYAVEHFIPYNFVSHDLIWNLIPANKSFNNSKSDKLPRLEKYFDGFYETQKSAIEIIRNKSPKNKFLEEYITIFPDLFENKPIEETFTKLRFKEKIQPLITIASNNGFEYL